MFDDLIYFIENSPVNEVVKMLKANGVKFKSDLEVSNMEKFMYQMASKQSRQKHLKAAK